MAGDQSYHKEDLRGDLLRAGLAYVTENGYASLSVRTLAQKVGVSPGAPYHHFPDRRSLLLAIALEGFKDLIGEAEAIAASGDRGIKQLADLGTGFIEFTDARPRLAELMYESELTSPVIDPQINDFQRIGQQTIRAAIRSELPNAGPMDVESRAVAFWSTIYGFAALRRKHNIQPFDTFGMDRNDAVKALVDRAVAMAAKP